MTRPYDAEPSIADIPVAGLPERVRPAVEGRGHVFANDRPGNRWTCINCGATLCAPYRPVYGDATRTNCPGVTAEGAGWRSWCLRNLGTLRRWREEGK